MPDVMDEFEEARETAKRKAEFLKTTFYVWAPPGGHFADTVVFDAHSRAGHPDWHYDPDGSRREATDEERKMWAMLPDPPES